LSIARTTWTAGRRAGESPSRSSIGKRSRLRSSSCASRRHPRPVTDRRLVLVSLPSWASPRLRALSASPGALAGPCETARLTHLEYPELPPRSGVPPGCGAAPAGLLAAGVRGPPAAGQPVTDCCPRQRGPRPVRSATDRRRHGGGRCGLMSRPVVGDGRHRNGSWGRRACAAALAASFEQPVQLLEFVVHPGAGLCSRQDLPRPCRCQRGCFG
jgi:hypothetical protein